MRTTWFGAIALATMTLVGPAKADPGPASPSPASPPAAPTVAVPVATAAATYLGPAPAQAEAMLQTFARMHAQHQQLATQTRSQMLAALSPAHRTLVATLVGGLSIAPSPDQAATARQLDATLSPSEQQAILRVNASALAQAQALAQEMRAQFESQMTPEQRAAIQRQFAQMKSDINHLTPEQRSALDRQHAQWQTMAPPVGTIMLPPMLAQDAGSILLRTLITPAGFVGQPYVGSSSMHSVIIQSAP